MKSAILNLLAYGYGFFAKATVVLCLCLLALVSCDNKDNEEVERAYEAAKNSLIKMIERNNAVTNWISNIESRPLCYSYHLQEKLLAEPNRPYLAVAYIEDVKKAKDEYLLTCTMQQPRFIGESYLMLTCSKDVVGKLEGEDFFQDYALIARISSVVSPCISISADVDFNYADENGDIALTDDSIPFSKLSLDPIVLVKGECLEIMNLHGYSGRLLAFLEQRPLD